MPPVFIIPFSPSSHSHLNLLSIIVRCTFLLVASYQPLPTLPHPIPFPVHLSQCLLSVNSVFLFLRLLASSNLFLSISVSAVALTPLLPRLVSLLLSLWFLFIFPLDACVWERACALGTPFQHAPLDVHINSSSHITLMKLFLGSDLTEVFNWTDKKVILSFN